MMERELTAHEKKQIRELIQAHCINIDKQSGECQPLETRCPMLDLQISTATLCRYFKTSVLPENTAIETIFNGQTADLKKCALCGKKFHACGRQKYCSACQDRARKMKSAQRNRKYRQKT